MHCKTTVSRKCWNLLPSSFVFIMIIITLIIIYYSAGGRGLQALLCWKDVHAKIQNIKPKRKEIIQSIVMYRQIKSRCTYIQYKSLIDSQNTQREPDMRMCLKRLCVIASSDRIDKNPTCDMLLRTGVKMT